MKIVFSLVLLSMSFSLAVFLLRIIIESAFDAKSHRPNVCYGATFALLVGIMFAPFLLNLPPAPGKPVVILLGIAIGGIPWHKVKRRALG